MRKKIRKRLFLAVLCVVLILIAIILIRHYHSKDEKPGGYLSGIRKGTVVLGSQERKIYELSRKYSFRFAHTYSVADGDTIKLADGTVIRYLGIDTPELAHDPGQKSEPGARLAYIENMNLVSGRKILLLTPHEKEYTYGRLLAYVFAPDSDGGPVYYINVSRYLLDKKLGDSKYGVPDSDLPDVISDSRLLKELAEIN